MRLILLLSLLGAFYCVTPTQASPINPTPLIISWPLTKAYPGIEYNIRLGVIGGSDPYRFSLDNGPAGMQISSNGTLTWIPDASLEGQSFDITLQVKDSLGQRVTQSFSLSVTQAGFYFVAAGGDDVTGTGSITQPWATINKALASGSTSDFLYVRGGTYTEAWQFQAGRINKLAAYPGEAVVADFDLQNGPYIHDSKTYVDGFEIRNIRFKAFQVDGNGFSRLVFRRNHMHHLYDPYDVGENPSFIFFWNIDADKPDQKEYQYNIFQENVFHDLFDRGSGINGDDSGQFHGGSCVWYNVAYSLYEDNEAYNIDGNGLSDKDDGYRNTYRGNHFHDNHYFDTAPPSGLVLMSQITEDGAEVSRNIFEDRLVVGWQPGYIANVEVHHNTFYRTGVTFRWVLSEARSLNFITRDNLFVDLSSYAYESQPGAGNKLLSNEGSFDYNLIDTAYAWVFGYNPSNLSFSDWQSLHGKDTHSILDDPQLVNPAQGDFRPTAGSPVCGAASDGGDIGALACHVDVMAHPLAPTGLSIQ